MSYPSYLPTFLTDSWRLDDLAWMRENREQRKTFAGILNKAIKDSDLKTENLAQDIIKELDDEYGKLVRATDTKVTSHNIRYIDGSVDEAGRGAGDAHKIPPDLEQEDNGVKSRPDVRYRWEDEPREDHVGDANSDGSGEARA